MNWNVFSDYKGVSGEEAPRPIRSAAELRSLATEPDGSFRLMCDIDLGGAEWCPAGTPEKPFCGRLDGNGHTVSNLRISSPDTHGSVGFFGANSGTVFDLTLSDVEICVDSARESYVGAVAAQNSGEIYGVKVVNSRIEACCTDGEMYLGSLVGGNTGRLRNAEAELNVKASARGGKVYAGGLVGRSSGGWLETAEFLGRMELSGDESAIAAGLFGGRMERTGLLACRFSSPMNTLNGRVFKSPCGEEGERLCYDGCLWRDNSNSDELLEKRSLALRERCEEHMRRMGTVRWSTDKRLVFRCSCGARIHGQTFEPGKVYTGIPYTHKHGSMERFLACFEQEGRLRPWLSTEGFDGFDMYMGNDCSGAVYWAWGRVTDSIDFRWTGDMLPNAALGTVRVGEYSVSEEKRTDEIVAANDENILLEAYARMHIGDAVVNKLPKGGHTRMCACAPVVYRGTDGEISTRESYMITHEQGGGLYPEFKPLGSSWLIDFRYSFQQLLKDSYIPVTIPVFEAGEAPEPRVWLRHEADAAESVVCSNYRIISVSLSVKDVHGTELQRHTVYTAVAAWSQDGNDARSRETVREVALDTLGNICLPKEPGCVCDISVLLSTGNEVYAGRLTPDAIKQRS